jgi:hypothetical protein
MLKSKFQIVNFHPLFTVPLKMNLKKKIAIGAIILFIIIIAINYIRISDINNSENVYNKKTASALIDPKTITIDELYSGSLANNTSIKINGKFSQQGGKDSSIIGDNPSYLRLSGINESATALSILYNTDTTSDTFIVYGLLIGIIIVIVY